METLEITRTELDQIIRRSVTIALSEYSAMHQSADKLYSKEELKELLGFNSDSAFYRAIHQKKIRVSKLGNKFKLLSPSPFSSTQNKKT
jgi:hypothetical protein